MSQRFGGQTVWGFFKGGVKAFVWLVRGLQAVVGLVLLLILASVVMGSMNAPAGPTVPSQAALVIDPAGVLVEQAQDIDPVAALSQEALGGSEPGEVEVGDVVDAIRRAADDERITHVVLKLQNLLIPASSASKAHFIAKEIDALRASGKPVIAVGDYYDQQQYLIASHADEVIMNPLGDVVLYGYGQYGSYFKSLLDKLEITMNVFRVGTYKAAVEPFLRDDMSPEAKEANAAFLSFLWRAYTDAVEPARGLPAGALDRYVDQAAAVLRAAGGDAAEAALGAVLVDKLQTRDEQSEYLKTLIGESEEKDKPFAQIGMRRYLVATRPQRSAGAAVGVVTAAGSILDGEHPAGTIGGDTLSRLIRTAREDDDVKAVVLRVDSPGGSAFASEIIRQEILETQAAGKPVVVSMGSLAASGGYWISANADEIWAAPTTITGSIGIFGLVPTFEKTLANIGVYTDGVATSELAGFNVTRPIPPIAADLIQQTIEHGYEEFLRIVADGRDMTPEAVDAVAQGRVWIGATAQDLGLVDRLGYLDDAIAAAAERAGLDAYEVKAVKRPLTPFEQFLMDVVDRMEARLPLQRRDPTPVMRLAAAILDEWRLLDDFNDPRGAYAVCLGCAF